jgi:uncharacterized membrane protein
MFELLHMNAEQGIFSFFFFSFSGWMGETIMESVVRRRFVSKGVFAGPWIPVHGVGAFVVYGALGPFKAYPVLVFAMGVLICTGVEYAAALFLENVFHTRGWDYDTYPFTKRYNYKRRVALATSLFFGLVAASVVYFYWDIPLRIINVLEPALLFRVDALLTGLFALDVFLTARKCIKNYRTGIPNKTVGLE